MGDSRPPFKKLIQPAVDRCRVEPGAPSTEDAINLLLRVYSLAAEHGHDVELDDLGRYNEFQFVQIADALGIPTTDLSVLRFALQYLLYYDGEGRGVTPEELIQMWACTPQLRGWLDLTAAEMPNEEIRQIVSQIVSEMVSAEDYAEMAAGKNWPERWISVRYVLIFIMGNEMFSYDFLETHITEAFVKDLMGSTPEHYYQGWREKTETMLKLMKRAEAFVKDLMGSTPEHSYQGWREKTETMLKLMTREGAAAEGEGVFDLDDLTDEGGYPASSVMSYWTSLTEEERSASRGTLHDGEDDQLFLEHQLLTIGSEQRVDADTLEWLIVQAESLRTDGELSVQVLRDILHPSLHRRAQPSLRRPSRLGPRLVPSGRLSVVPCSVSWIATNGNLLDILRKLLQEQQEQDYESDALARFIADFEHRLSEGGSEGGSSASKDRF